MKDTEIKSLNREFKTISVSNGAGSSGFNNINKADVTDSYQTIPDGLMEVKDPAIIELIMENYGDSFARKILLSVTQRPMTVMDILLECAIPQTTGYRKILKLIEEQFLIPFDTIRKSGGKRVSRYISSFSDIQIRINTKTVTIYAKQNEKSN